MKKNICIFLISFLILSAPVALAKSSEGGSSSTAGRIAWSTFKGALAGVLIGGVVGLAIDSSKAGSYMLSGAIWGGASGLVWSSLSEGGIVYNSQNSESQYLARQKRPGEIRTYANLVSINF